MKKILSAIFITVILFSGIFVASCSNNSPTSIPSESTAPVIGKTAPDFQFTGLDGSIVKLSGLVGKPVLVNFWATWCTPCMEEMPFMQQISNNWTSQGLVFLSIDNGESADTTKSFIQKNGYTFNVFPDPKGTVAAKYGIRALPTTLLVDKNGILLYMLPGAFPDEKSIETEVLSKVFPQINGQ